MRLGLLSVVVCIFAIFAVPGASTASAEQPSSTSSTSVSVIDKATIWIYQKQREFHRELTSNFRRLSKDGSAGAAWALIVASFLYGVFHAAGPGHGKAVMSGYLLTHRQSLRRGVLLATAASFTQGLVAILIVFGLITLAGWLPRETQSAVMWSERASFALVAMIGFFLLYRALKSLYRKMRSMAVSHGHDHDHHDGCCGHQHAPSQQQIEAATDWRTALGVVLSIGARPCTGAVIVLVFAKVVSMPLAGIGAVLAMSLGTAITVSSIATAAVGARGLSERLSPLQGRTAAYAVDAVAAVGGALILFLGLSLLSTAFGQQHPLGLA